VSHLLTRGVHTDFALVMKPGNAIYHEEPGLCWFEVSVKGTMGYAWMPRGRPGFRSSKRVGRRSCATMPTASRRWIYSWSQPFPFAPVEQD
jgi:hypothetical protein